MEQDPYAYDEQIIEATQQATQSQSQEDKDPWDDTIWGILKPARPGLPKLNLSKRFPCVTIGRSSENSIIFSNLKVSNKHCSIKWDGKSGNESVVTVLDHSTNGTYIDGKKVGKERTCLLYDGNEIAFGPWNKIPGPDDFRFIFRFTAGGAKPDRPLTGLFAFYDVGHELGRGSFATVFYAVHNESGHPYAIKRIHKNNLRADRNATKSFMREIEILRKIQHPNVCALKESFEDEGSIDLVLEYVDGGDLLEYIIGMVGVPEDAARELTYQLCDAMNFIHKSGVGHRDLKPENILLTKDDPPMIKVADFGLAKAVDSVSQFRTMCGTPCYLAPEVILRDGQQAYDYKVDNWSIGVIVFAMIANANPFVEETQSQNIAQRFANRYIDWEPLDERRVTSDCKHFIRRFLDENPRTRMTCDEALKHPWLAPAGARSRQRPLSSASSTTSAAATASIAALKLQTEAEKNASFMSLRANAGSFDESFIDNMGVGAQTGPPGSTPAALPLEPSMQAQIEMRVVGASTGTKDSDAMMASIPGAFPRSQDLQERQERHRREEREADARSRRLSRQPMEIGQKDDTGGLFDFRAFPAPPASDHAGPVCAEKRAGRDDAVADGTLNTNRSMSESNFQRDASESTDSIRDNDANDKDVGEAGSRGEEGESDHRENPRPAMQRAGTKRKERSCSVSICPSRSPSPGTESDASLPRSRGRGLSSFANGSGPSDSSLTPLSETNTAEFGALPPHERNRRSVSSRKKANTGADAGVNVGASTGPMTRSSTRGRRNTMSKRSRR